MKHVFMKHYLHLTKHSPIELVIKQVPRMETTAIVEGLKRVKHLLQSVKKKKKRKKRTKVLPSQKEALEKTDGFRDSRLARKVKMASWTGNIHRIRIL